MSFLESIGPIKILETIFQFEDIDQRSIHNSLEFLVETCYEQKIYSTFYQRMACNNEMPLIEIK